MTTVDVTPYHMEWILAGAVVIHTGGKWYMYHVILPLVLNTDILLLRGPMCQRSGVEWPTQFAVFKLGLALL